jgi:hypothetical protein
MEETFTVWIEIFDANGEKVDSIEIPALLPVEEVCNFRQTFSPSPLLMACVKEAMEPEFRLKEGDELELIRISY